jgi:hypothetical protein
VREHDWETPRVLTKFWEEIGAKLGSRWAETSIPALVFWTAAVLAVTRDGAAGARLDAARAWFVGQQTLLQAVVLLAGALAVMLSGVVVDRLAHPALRLLEGYWPGPLARLSTWRVEGIARRAAELDGDFQRLENLRRRGELTPEQAARLVAVDRTLRRLPAEGHRLPTRIGNTLRAAERRPAAKYGLDAVTVWPHLWLVLPDAVRTELAAARAGVNGAVAALIWSVLLIAFSPFTWWAGVIGIAGAFVVHRFWLPPRVEVFADLVEASFDLYRPTLYQQLRWPLPTDPADELQVGAQVTAYLWRGSRASTPTFTDPPSA